MIVSSVPLDIFIKTIVICYILMTTRDLYICLHEDSNPCHVICLDNKSVQTSEQNRKEGES